MKTHKSGTDTTENYTFRNLRDMINPIPKKRNWDVDNIRSKGTQLSADLKTATDAQNHISQINVHHCLGLTVTDFITVKKKSY